MRSAHSRLCRSGPSIHLPAPTGVEPRVSTRPSDPRRRAKGGRRSLSVPRSALAWHVPSPRFYGERVRVRGSFSNKNATSRVRRWRSNS
ncbi:hypothetical protein EOS93_25730 [Rhizobium sp. RMa-01]|nr:hypothetical protein EOS93_25730 [Rhizobium sp. RMa-01]